MNNLKGIVYLLVVFLIVGCATTKRDWENTQNLNTVNAYQEFLSAHPKSSYTVEAETRIENIYWEKAVQLNTINAYKNYLDSYPNGAHNINATQNIEKLTQAIEEQDWIKAQRNNSFEDYNNFLHEHPESTHKLQAKERVDAIISSASPITNDELKMIDKKIANKIAPFKLSDLYDKSMTASQALGKSRQHFGMQGTFEAGVETIVYRIESGSIIKKTRTKQEEGGEVKVTLQALPEDGIVDVFHKKIGMPKSKHQLRIINAKYSNSTGIKFSEIEIDDYKGIGKRIHIICLNDKCYDYDFLTLK